MTVFQALFVGFIIGSIAVMFCIWLAGGSLYAKPEKDGKAPDDAATSKPRHTK